MYELIAASWQALEALEDLYAEQNAAPLWKRREHWENSMIKAEVAMPALRTAIEAAEKQEPVLKPCWYESKEKTMCRKCGQVHAEAIPPAAQRQWVGLDEEEIKRAPHHMVDGAYHYSFKQGAKWADAKLREKNGGAV